MSEKYEEEDVYVLLDFEGKDIQLLKQPDVPFKMLNLSTNNPIAEIGNDVYEGTYEDAIGTNVFFEEAEDPVVSTNVFEGRTPIALKYLLKQTKILKMKKVGAKSKPLLGVVPVETVNIKIENDYKALLEKYENGTLDIENCKCDKLVEESKAESTSDESDEVTEVETLERKEASEQNEPQVIQKDNEPILQIDACSSSRIDDGFNAKYAKLKVLAQQPTKHKIINDFIRDPLQSLSKAEFVEWRRITMQKVEEESITLDIKQNNIEDFVDVEKSVRAGIIGSSNLSSRAFTEEEKCKLLSLQNFVNLSVFMKYVVLHDLIKQLGKLQNQMNSQQLNEKDAVGCTIKERLVLLMDFKNELHSYITCRLQAEGEYETEEISFFSEDEELSG